MKKAMTFLGVIVATLVLMTSCGGSSSKKKSITLPDAPTDLKYEAITSIEGPLSKYVEVVPGSYLFELEKKEDRYSLGYSGIMNVKFKFIKPIDIKAGSGYNYYGPSLIGKALDAQGIPLDFKLSINKNKDLATYLKRGTGEEWLTLDVSGQGICNNVEDAALQLAKYEKGKKIRFNSEIVEEKFESSSSSSNSSSKSSSDCEEFLKGYEKFMNEYIAILKKYKNNPSDMTIMSEYTSLMMKATEWNTKVADCASDAKFAQKISTIQKKIAKAAAGL
ncbi:MAG: hypothetical protein RBR35_15230 [Salinivirgaceae bacterium]|nr:hypothetical protein [Salinivirgaceae bacterium]